MNIFSADVDQETPSMTQLHLKLYSFNILALQTTLFNANSSVFYIEDLVLRCCIKEKTEKLKSDFIDISAINLYH